MTLSVYHRIEMGQREVSDKEFKNIAKALEMTAEELKEEIKSLEDKGMLEEIIQRNDAKYKLLSTPRAPFPPLPTPSTTVRTTSRFPFTERQAKTAT